MVALPLRPPIALMKSPPASVGDKGEDLRLYCCLRLQVNELLHGATSIDREHGFRCFNVAKHNVAYMPGGFWLRITFWCQAHNKPPRSVNKCEFYSELFEVTQEIWS